MISSSGGSAFVSATWLPAVPLGLAFLALFTIHVRQLFLIFSAEVAADCVRIGKRSGALFKCFLQSKRVGAARDSLTKPLASRKACGGAANLTPNRVLLLSPARR